ncbi:MAG TPA: hypothetical protein DCY89_02135 [Gammaproteobacteria bacterium]|nr:hypothetical protein [Gammaproteobacteria bacterium]
MGHQGQNCNGDNGLKLQYPSEDALVLEVAGRTVRFTDPASFDFALQPRAKVSLETQLWLAALSPEGVTNERNNLRRLRRWLGDMLPQRLSAPKDLRPEDLPDGVLTLQADEHQWVALLQGLGTDGQGHGPFVTIALVRFNEYLVERDASLVRSQRHQFRAGVPLGPSVTSPLPLACGSGRGDSLGDTAEAVASVFSADETASVSDQGTPSGRWRPLARGRPERCSLSAGQALHLNCAGVPLALCHIARQHGGESLGAEEIALKPGTNVLGRDPACDVIVPGSHHSVSRMHVLIEDHGNGELVLTDLSRNGTSIEVGTR